MSRRAKVVLGVAAALAIASYASYELFGPPRRAQALAREVAEKLNAAMARDLDLLAGGRLDELHGRSSRSFRRAVPFAAFDAGVRPLTEPADGLDASFSYTVEDDELRFKKLTIRNGARSLELPPAVETH